MAQVTLLLGVTVLILLGYSSGLELDSEELTLPKPLTVVVQFGKDLKVNVVNINYATLLWRFNGRAVSEQCEPEMTPNRSTLICTDMHWSDAGLYECQGITRSGRKKIVLAVNVKIAECTEKLAAAQRIMAMDSDFQCFCSGITDECSMADGLFRRKIAATVSDMVDLTITDTVVEESRSVDYESESTKYYVLPKELKGNLLKSYGGYMDFPSTLNEIDDDEPDLVLQGKHRALVYFNRPEVSEELSRNRVLMTERNWRQLNDTFVSRDTFLTVLSNVREFYVKHNQYWNFEPIQIVLDSADFIDYGLGKVTTVEQCKCRTGYRGLSCESCSRGFYRRAAILEKGICVSVKEKLILLASALQKSTNQSKNN